jgi:hypothetical protein
MIDEEKTERRLGSVSGVAARLPAIVAIGHGET